MKRAALVLSLLSLGALAVAQTSPKQQFGHGIGDDYWLANYIQFGDYWKKLDQDSPRFKLVEIGKSEEGRPQYMGVISDPANMANLGRYREIAAKLAKGEISGSDANRLAGEGKSVVWIDGGLHASEVLCAQVLMELSWQLVSRKDDETQNILKNCIVLLVNANPDGMQLCANWYMRNPKPEERSLRGLPVLYQKYIGHDDNRDFFTSTQSEVTNMNRVMYRQWYPQIVYNQHQTGPAGTVMFAPPFRDPFPYEVDPLVRSGLDMVSSAMENRFLSENKPGVTVRSGAPYSGWWNGGLRTMAYFHNMVGILTETIGSPTPMDIPFVASKQVPTMDLLSPIKPQKWHFRQSVDYSITSCYAILDYASRYRRDLLMNIYRMGRNNIARGRKDSWTPDPRRIAAAKSMDDLQKPEDRTPYAYVVPSTQEDFGTATKFVDALIKTGIAVRRASKPFDYDGQTWPAGSYVVRCDQAFRPHVISMFEPQDHPDDIPYAGAAPIPPYDSAGWTLAY
ncbi:MAG TPA: M14 metallopeptidase family protein, partial [Fimbriimonadaceae bacterium]|nr:M14 metallopeptidase family protein [Fimbriimonadaceae bacterium]